MHAYNPLPRARRTAKRPERNIGPPRPVTATNGDQQRSLDGMSSQNLPSSAVCASRQQRSPPERQKRAYQVAATHQLGTGRCSDGFLTRSIVPLHFSKPSPLIGGIHRPKTLGRGALGAEMGRGGKNIRGPNKTKQAAFHGSSVERVLCRVRSNVHFSGFAAHDGSGFFVNGGPS